MIGKIKSYFNKPKTHKNILVKNIKNIRYHNLKNRNSKLKSMNNYKKRKLVIRSNRLKNSLDYYNLSSNLIYINIERDPVSKEIEYKVIEPSLNDDDKENLVRLKELLKNELRVQSKNIESRDLAEEYLNQQIDKIYDKHSFQVTRKKKDVYKYYLIKDNIGLGKIEPLMLDPMIEDISCDGEDVPIYIWHRIYESISTNLMYKESEELDSFIHRLAYLCNRHVSVAQPMIDASLPDGSRINLTYGREITQRGSTFTIRKFTTDPLTIIDLIKYNTMSPWLAAYLWFIVENRLSILLSGGIASGKTTLLNCISMFITPDKKIVSIEDTPELKLPHENWIQSVSRTGVGSKQDSTDVSLMDLLQASLRQRPDYIIVGEIRGKEAYTLFQAMGTGHLGMSTIHGDSVDAVIYRLESEPMNIPRSLISGIDCLTVQRRVRRDGLPVRRTFVTTEIVGIDPRTKEIITNEVYKWNAVDDTYTFSGRSYLIERICEKSGMDIRTVMDEIENRKKLLEWMAKNNIRAYQDVSNYIRKYHSNKNLLTGVIDAEN